MNEKNLSVVDLNLLVVLAAVFRERSTTKAAERLRLSQPAVSHALRRLRTLVDDPLFVRAQRGLSPTPRAEELHRELAPHLEGIERALHGRRDFEPSTTARTFRLGVPSAIDVCATPVLLHELARLAPKASLVVRPADLHTGAGLIDTENIEVAVSHFPEAAGWHRQIALGPRNYACLFDGARLGLPSPLTLERYLSVDHVLTSFSGDISGVVDEALAQRGLTRRVVASTADFSSIPFYLKTAYAVATLPAYATRLYAERLGLTWCPPPLELPDFALSMIWHGRNDRDPGHRWFRTLVAAAVARTT